MPNLEIRDVRPALTFDIRDLPADALAWLAFVCNPSGMPRPAVDMAYPWSKGGTHVPYLLHAEHGVVEFDHDAVFFEVERRKHIARPHATFSYTNHAGITGRRTVRPERLYFGSSEHHPTAQWLLDAWDLDRGARRTFAMANVRDWATA